MVIQSKITAEYGKLTFNVLVLVVGFDSDHKKYHHVFNRN